MIKFVKNFNQSKWFTRTCPNCVIFPLPNPLKVWQLTLKNMNFKLVLFNSDFLLNRDEIKKKIAYFFHPSKRILRSGETLHSAKPYFFSIFFFYELSLLWESNIISKEHNFVFVVVGTFIRFWRLYLSPFFSHCSHISCIKFGANAILPSFYWEINFDFQTISYQCMDTRIYVCAIYYAKGKVMVV